MKRQFGVKLDPVTEVVPLPSARSRPMRCCRPCFINPGDVTLMTVPGYPVAGTHTRYYGGEVHKLPLLEENGFFPDLDGIPADIKKRAKLLVINYPNSPTGAVATKDFYKRVIEFAHKNQIVVVQDAAHILLTLRRRAAEFPAGRWGEGGRRRGAFDVEGLQHDRLAARLGVRPSEDRASLRRREGQQRFRSVHGDPAGRRRGPAASGNPAADPREVSPPAARSWSPPSTRSASRRRCRAAAISSTRRRRWRRAIASFTNAEEASQFLITEQSVCCVPWDDAGAYLRFSATYLAKDEAEEDALMAETVERLGRLKLRF